MVNIKALDLVPLFNCEQGLTLTLKAQYNWDGGNWGMDLFKAKKGNRGVLKETLKLVQAKGLLQLNEWPTFIVENCVINLMVIGPLMSLY